MAEQRPLLRDPDADDYDGLVGRELTDVPVEKWARGLVEMIEVMEAAFRRVGIGEELAFRLASDGAFAVAEYHGGRQFYLPRGDALITAVRDAAIYRRANRANIESLAAEHGLTVSQIYRICRQQRALHIGRTQGRLFDDQGDKR